MKLSRLIALFCTAYVVRLLYLLEWSGSPLFNVLIGDGRQYDVWARAISAGGWLGSEVFYQAPLYPYFLGVIYSTLGDGPWVVRLVQITLGSASCVLLALAGRSFFDERVGLVAGFVLALYAPAIYFDGLVQKATLAGFLTTLLLWCLGRHLGSTQKRWVVGSGVVLGLLALTRENALILVPIVGLWLLGPKEKSIARRAREIAWFLAALVLVLVPVALRNQALGGGFSPTTSQLGPNFYIGNHAGANGCYVPLREGRGDPRYERHDATELAERARGRRLGADEVSDYWLDRSLSYVRSEPGEWIGLMARKALLVWHAGEVMDVDSLAAYTDESILLRLLGSVSHFGVLAPLAFLGVWYTRARRRELWLLYAIVLSISGAVALFYVMGRYRFPMVPVLALFAAAALCHLFGRWRQRAWNPLGGAVVALLVLAVPCNWPLHGDVDPRVITGYSLGRALVENGRHDEGRELLRGVIEREPAFTAAHYALGDAYVREGRPAEATAHFEEALRQDPRHAHALTGLGMVLYQSGASERALEYFRRAVEIDPGLAAAHNNLAAALARLGRLEEAAVFLERAARALPGDPDVLANLGMLRLALGDPAAARARFTQALEIRPDHPQALQGMTRLP